MGGSVSKSNDDLTINELIKYYNKELVKYRTIYTEFTKNVLSCIPTDDELHNIVKKVYKEGIDMLPDLSECNEAFLTESEKEIQRNNICNKILKLEKAIQSIPNVKSEEYIDYLRGQRELSFLTEKFPQYIKSLEYFKTFKPEYAQEYNKIIEHLKREIPTNPHDILENFNENYKKLKEVQKISRNISAYINLCHAQIEVDNMRTLKIYIRTECNLDFIKKEGFVTEYTPSFSKKLQDYQKNAAAKAVQCNDKMEEVGEFDISKTEFLNKHKDQIITEVKIMRGIILESGKQDMKEYFIKWLDEALPKINKCNISRPSIMQDLDKNKGSR